jgi:hypothetical protein
MSNKVNSESTLAVEITLRLTESEARALKEMVGYGVDAFLKSFYTKLGTHYLKPHESGVRSLFETIKRELPPHLNKADRARKAFKGEL